MTIIYCIIANIITIAIIIALVRAYLKKNKSYADDLQNDWSEIIAFPTVAQEISEKMDKLIDALNNIPNNQANGNRNNN